MEIPENDATVGEEDAFHVLCESYSRILREEEGFKATRIQPLAIEALQWAAEAFISDLFSDSVDEMVHAKRKTLNIEDLHITIKMKGYKYDLLEDWNLSNPRNSNRGRALS